MNNILEKPIRALLHDGTKDNPQGEMFYAHLIMNMKRHMDPTLPAIAAVNVTEHVNLYINPEKFAELTLAEQVAVLKHECISGKSLIDTDKGKLPIHEIVNKKLPVKVLSVSPSGKLEYKEIIEYSKKPVKKDSKKYWVSLVYNDNTYLYRTLTCTNDHRIAYIENPLSQEIKYVIAQDAKDKYSIRKINTTRPKNMERPAFNRDQLSVIIGCLLGDSSISEQGSLRHTGSLKYEEYTNYKKEILGGRIDLHASGYTGKKSILQLDCGVTEQSKYFRELMYIDGKKTPENIIDLIDPISLAFWFMDDGSWNNYGSSFFHTEGFTLDQTQSLVNMLETKFGIKAFLNKRTNGLYNILMKKDGTKKLFNIIAPYMHHSMKHKIHKDYHHLLGTGLIDKTHLDYSIKKITKIKKRTISSSYYDIGVKDNHNFFANDTLVHNCLHVICDHFSRFDFKNKDERMNYNQAADAAINQLIPEMPPTFSSGGMPIHIDHLKKQFPDILEKETSEYYYNYFDKNAPRQPSPGEGFGDLVDDHGKWEEGSQSPETVRNVLKDALQKSAESTKQCHGNVPDNVQYTLNKLAKSVVDWQAQLRRFVVSAIDSKKEDTRKKRHKRFGIVHAGSKVEEILHIAFITDTSGSMSDRALEQAWAEMAKIAKMEVNITAIEADSVVQNVYKFDPKKVPSFTGRGGTAYQPALDKAEELKVDAIVFLGDMDCADTPRKPRTPVLWAVVGHQEPPGGFGRKVIVGDF